MGELSVKQWIGLGLSVVGSIFGIIFLTSIFNGGGKDFWAAPAFLCAAAAYILCGGLGYAVKSAWGIAKALWFLIPHFPVYVILGFGGFILGVFFLFFIPVIFVVKSIRNKEG